MVKFLFDWCSNIAETYIVFLLCDLLSRKKIYFNKNIILLFVVSLITLGIQRIPWLFNDEFINLFLTLLAMFLSWLIYYFFYHYFIFKINIFNAFMSALICLVSTIIFAIVLNLLIPQQSLFPDMYELSYSLLFYTVIRIVQIILIKLIGGSYEKLHSKIGKKSKK